MCPRLRWWASAVLNGFAALAGEHIRLLGVVDDLAPCYDRARVFIAPCRFAAGVPAKVIEAACNGIPVVASALLVQQLDWTSPSEILSATDAASFAQAMADLYHDESLWNVVQHQSRLKVQVQASPEAFERTVQEVLLDSAIDIDRHPTWVAKAPLQ